jgi:transcriptional regulator with XRE-family HTH domain
MPRFTSNPPLAYIGARIRAARINAGLTQADLAKAAGVSRPQVANIEAGVTDTPLRVFVAMVAALKLDPTNALREPTCDACGDQPPGGFTCNACGRSEVAHV